MSYSLEWIEEGRILLLKGRDRLSSEDFQRADADIVEIADQITDHKIYLIADLTHTTIMPPVRVMQAANFPKHPHFGFAVIVGDVSALVEILTKVIASLFRVHYYTAPTIEAGMQLVHHVDPSLSAKVGKSS